MLCSLKPQWRWFTEVITTGVTNDLFACDNASIIIFSNIWDNHSRTELTLISSHGMLGLPVQQNLNSRSPFLTFSRCQKLPFYLIFFCLFFDPSRDLKSIDRQRLVCFCSCWFKRKEKRSSPYNKLQATIGHHFCASAPPICLLLTVVGIETVDSTIGNQAFSHDRCNTFPGLSCK